jgi:hypothetical protein
MTSPYDAGFYAEGRRHALQSARRLVPAILRLVPARSVVDVGCGLGTWLSVFVEHGVADVLGIDGGHVRGVGLEIAADRFLAHDLSRPLTLTRRFDLAMSLEVAEHLPAAAAAGFVAGLCALAPVVLFSAAVPSQGGVHHVNEQWPDHWARCFAAHDYMCADVLRLAFWDDPDVSWWYAQNACLYVARAALPGYAGLAAAASERPPRRYARAELVEANLHRKRLLDTLVELLGRVPAGRRALVADGAQLLSTGREIARFEWIPFLERDGAYWGAPADAAHAVAELERLRAAGAEVIAFVWPCLWWLETYAGLAEHLQRHYRRVYGSANVVVWDLTVPGA